MLFSQSAAAAFSGRLQETREFSRRAVDLAERRNLKDAAAGIVAGQALREAAFGNFQQASERAAQALAMTRSQNALESAAIALAVSGAAAQAQPLID